MASIRHLWHKDKGILEALSTRTARTGEQVSIPGIENCVTSHAYVERENPTELKANLIDWLMNSDEGGVRVVTGKAGSGKTNFLLKLVLDNLYEKRSVIWFPLFRFSPKLGLLGNLRGHLQSILGETSSDFNLALSEMLCRSDTVIVLDGLDELSKLQGRRAAIDVTSSIQGELGTDHEVKVVITCRDDIYRSLREDIGMNAAEVLEIPKLPEEGIRNRLSIFDPTKGKEAVEVLREFPIFMRFLDPNQLPDPFPINANQLFLELVPGEGKEANEKLILLGRIAKEMLAERKDYLDPNSFKTFDDNTKVLFSDPAFLLREKNNDVRFSHHNIREFVLAWNVRHSLTSPEQSTWRMLSETCNLDYVGAEIYRAVSELGGIDDWSEVKKRSSSDNSSWDRHNNFLWGAFETAGMLGIESTEQRELVLDWVKEVLDRPVDGRDSKVSFQAKYNAARCLERLHDLAPRPYWQWVTESRKEGTETWRTKGKLLIYSHAVRGFQRSRLDIGDKPPLELCRREDMDKTPAEDSQEEFSDLLLRKIAELTDLVEIGENARFLLVNLSHALVRWYSPLHKSRLLEILGKHNVDWNTEVNLRLILRYWENERTERNSIVWRNEDDPYLRIGKRVNEWS